mgnify:FL=1
MHSIDYNNLSDRQLVQAVLAGNTAQFRVIIRRTERLVGQIIFKMVNNAEDRKDITQDVYLKVFRNMAGFGFRSSLSTWVATIAYNTCFNYLGKKKLVFSGDLYTEKDDDVGESAEGYIFQKQQWAIISAEIDKLPPVYKTLVTLYHNEEMSYGEIAQITGLPVGTVKSYLFRARKTLKDNLLDKYKKGEL